MKKFRIYVLDGDEFKYVDTKTSPIAVKLFVSHYDNKFSFIAIENYTVNESNGDQHMCWCLIYLGGVCIRRYRHKVTVDDIVRLRKKLTTLYKANGDVLYYPDSTFSCTELKELFRLADREWFTIGIVKDKPERYAVVHYDWNQREFHRTKQLNVAATKRFKRELFGDVLFINENFIS